MSTEYTPTVPAAAALPANGEIELVNFASGEGWIETSRCTSCDACTNRNRRMFKYNENKQACIADLHAGTYRELVEAAEACKVPIIHPGEPWNPDEPDLDGAAKTGERRSSVNKLQSLDARLRNLSTLVGHLWP